ncbi:MAG: PhoU domain-containing protein, partial [Oscillospiraceae bacterium]|nr:PhoU domain-containing protein [Oscillospiraceae bacterium]
LDITEMSDYIRNAAFPEHIDLGEMARAAVKMVTDSVDAFVKRDVEMAEAVIKYDDVMDELFIKVKHAVTDMISADPQTGEYAVDLMMTAKYFERIGDHAVNIAEWVEFSVTGIHKGEMINDMVRRGR